MIIICTMTGLTCLKTRTPDRDASRGSSSRGLSRNDSYMSAHSFLPPTIWCSHNPWVPNTAGSVRYTQDRFAEKVFEHATRPRIATDAIPILKVKGTTASEMASNVLKMIEDAVESGDFRHILSPSRDFIV